MHIVTALKTTQVIDASGQDITLAVGESTFVRNSDVARYRKHPDVLTVTAVQPTGTTTDAAGNVTGLVGPNGRIALPWTTSRKVILSGDSITSQNWSQVVFNETLGENEPTLIEGYDTQMNGYAEVVNAMLGCPYTFVNAGKSGANSAAVLAYLEKNVANHPDAAEVWWHVGVNDINGGVSSATLITNTIAAADLALSKGMRFVWSSTIMPALAQAWTTTQRNSLAYANSTIRNTLSSYKNVDIVDVSGRLLDTANANGWTNPAYLYDNLHPSNNGAFLWALLLKDVLSYRLPQKPGAVDSPADSYAVENTSVQIMVDPLCLGALTTNGAADGLGTGVSGTKLTSYSIVGRTVGGASDTAVMSIVDAPSGIGKAQRVVVTAGTGACTFRFIDGPTANTTTILPGKTYEEEVFVKCSNVSGFTTAYLEHLATVTGTPTNPSTYGLVGGASPDGITYSGDFTLRIRIRNKMPADLTGVSVYRHAIYLMFAATGGGTFDFYQRSCRRID